MRRPKLKIVLYHWLQLIFTLAAGEAMHSSQPNVFSFRLSFELKPTERCDSYCKPRATIALIFCCWTEVDRDYVAWSCPI